MHTEAPKVIAVIVTWNKKADVLRLLGQLDQIRYPKDRLSILVVDNHSTDATVPAIETFHPSVRILKHARNLGGSGGFNSGMRWALENCPDASYLWLLDNDVQVDPDVLKGLVAALEANPAAALCGSRIMNLYNRGELIEAGAFIDYRSGDIRCNRPKNAAHPLPAVWQVDYVAACSLLARAAHVREMGLWREAFFIYWDDMEWGARFKRAGYEVLATNQSIVYHPSWIERTADHTAVWRTYYRVRNALWFFNNYCSGVHRRLLLARMMLRFMIHVVSSSVNANTALSRAFISGIRDFFANRYGEKRFDPPKTDLKGLLKEAGSWILPVFVQDAALSERVLQYLRTLVKAEARIRIKAIIPEAVAGKWEPFFPKADLLAYRRHRNGGLRFSEKVRIMRFLGDIGDWRVMLSPLHPLRMASIWGRWMARINFERGEIISIERAHLKETLRIALEMPAFLFKALFFAPKTGLNHCNTATSDAAKERPQA
jgi:GT2 family glycosyltransferase